MRKFKLFALAAVAGICLAAAAPPAQAQVGINIQIGPEPACPYGYFDYAPYRCAPFGYYGPQWFTGGLFLGTGPWFRGPEGFRGYVNRDYDPRYGYHGYFPRRGEHADWGRHRGWEQHYRGNYEYRHDNGNHNGQYKDRGDHGNGHGNGHDNGHGHGNGHDNGHGNGHDHNR